MRRNCPLLFSQPFTVLPEVFNHAPAEQSGKRKLFIVVSSDKGLCGGIHSSVSKQTRRTFAEKDATFETDSPIMVIGDKSKAQLSRALPKNLVMTFNQIGRDIPTFADAAGVADLIMKSGVEYDSIAIVYNKFVSAISYEPAIVEVETADALKESGESSIFTRLEIATLTIFCSWFPCLRNGGRCDQGSCGILSG